MRRWLALSAALSIVSLAGCGESGAPSSRQALEQVNSGDYDEAIATATEAIAGDPEDASSYLSRGRAYHFRGAAGDLDKALADFTDAIRLKPDLSDAYYRRALVYRDLGNAELSQADEEKARELDDRIRAVYKRLPDQTPAPLAPELKVEKDAIAKGKESVNQNNRDMYDKLKGTTKYEPGFGSLRTSKQLEDLKKKEELRDARKERYRELMSPSGIALPREQDPRDRDADLLGGVDVNNPTEEDRTRTAAEGNTAAGNMPPGAAPGAQSAPGNRRAAQTGLPPSQPPALRSPFPQRTPAPTGYTAPVPSNPFAPQSRTPTSGSNVGRPFSSGPAYNPYSNPAVRPANPRDYLP